MGNGSIARERDSGSRLPFFIIGITIAFFRSLWILPVIKELLTISRINWDKGDDNDLIREIGNGSRKDLEWQLFIRWTIDCTEGVQNEESEQPCGFIK